MKANNRQDKDWRTGKRFSPTEEDDDESSSDESDNDGMHGLVDLFPDQEARRRIIEVPGRGLIYEDSFTKGSTRQPAGKEDIDIEEQPEEHSTIQELVSIQETAPQSPSTGTITTIPSSENLSYSTQPSSLTSSPPMRHIDETIYVESEDSSEEDDDSEAEATWQEVLEASKAITVADMGKSRLANIESKMSAFVNCWKSGSDDVIALLEELTKLFGSVERYYMETPPKQLNTNEKLASGDVHTMNAKLEDARRSLDIADRLSIEVLVKFQHDTEFGDKHGPAIKRFFEPLSSTTKRRLLRSISIYFKTCKFDEQKCMDFVASRIAYDMPSLVALQAAHLDRKEGQFIKIDDRLEELTLHLLEKAKDTPGIFHVDRGIPPRQICWASPASMEGDRRQSALNDTFVELISSSMAFQMRNHFLSPRTWPCACGRAKHKNEKKSVLVDPETGISFSPVSTACIDKFKERGYIKVKRNDKSYAISTTDMLPMSESEFEESVIFLSKIGSDGPFNKDAIEEVIREGDLRTVLSTKHDDIRIGVFMNTHIYDWICDPSRPVPNQIRDLMNEYLKMGNTIVHKAGMFRATKPEHFALFLFEYTHTLYDLVSRQPQRISTDFFLRNLPYAVRDGLPTRLMPNRGVSERLVDYCDCPACEKSGWTTECEMKGCTYRKWNRQCAGILESCDDALVALLHPLLNSGDTKALSDLLESRELGDDDKFYCKSCLEHLKYLASTV